MSEVKLQTQCSQCESAEVYYDKHHAEIYCRNCGVVLVKLYSIANDNLLDYDFSDFKEVS